MHQDLPRTLLGVQALGGTAPSGIRKAQTEAQPLQVRLALQQNHGVAIRGRLLGRAGAGDRVIRIRHGVNGVEEVMAATVAGEAIMEETKMLLMATRRLGPSPLLHGEHQLRQSKLRTALLSIQRRGLLSSHRRSCLQSKSHSNRTSRRRPAR
jgi:hypothetical protein